MDVQAAPPPINSADFGRPPMGNPPALGQQVPGHTGGLPAQGGLSVLRNPMADKLQSMGRGQDSMLVHMTPEEVGGLQHLAQASGGSLTINPHTGLPEAGWLGKLLPSILGAVGMAFGIPPIWMGAAGLVGGTAITGDLKKGLLAGLGAFGGASMAGAAGLGGVAGHVGQGIGLSGSTAAVMHPAATAGTVGANAAQSTAANAVLAQADKLGWASPAFQTAAEQGARTATGASGILGGFKQAATAGLSGPIGGTLAKVAVPAATMGVLGSVSGSGGVKDPKSGAVNNSYQGGYYSEPRPATFANSTQELLDSSKERTYFANSQPGVFNAQGQMVQPGSDTEPGTEIWRPILNPNAKKGENMYSFAPQPWMGGQSDQQYGMVSPIRSSRRWWQGMAEGGTVHMDEGSFVMPARETAEFGKGSTRAGQEVLAGLGGIPIHGSGTGVSDDIHARIGNQEARVADGEVHFPANAVAKLGGGDHSKGTQKLYSMMRRAEQSRKHAARGGTGLDLLKSANAA